MARKTFSLPVPILLLLSFLCLSSVSMSQIPEIEWQFSLDIESVDFVESIIETEDGGYLVAAKIAENYEYNAMGFSRGYLIKLNSAGELQWQLDLGTPTFDRYISFTPVELAGAGGYIVRYAFNGLAKVSVSGVMGPKITTESDIVNLVYFNSQIIVLTTAGRLRVYNENLGFVVERDISALGIPEDMAPDLNDAGVVVAASNGSDGTIAGVGLNGATLWEHTYSGQKITRIQPFISKVKSSLTDFSSFDVIDHSVLYRGYDQDDYLMRGVSGTATLWTGEAYGSQFEGTPSSIVSLVTTKDGRVVVTRLDSLIVMNGKLETIWQTAELRGKRIYLKDDGSILYFGDLNLQVVKTKPAVFDHVSMFSMIGYEDLGEYYDYEGGVSGQNYMATQFFDFNKDGALDVYLLGNNLHYFSVDATYYTSTTLNALIRNTGSGFEVLNTKLNTSQQWDNYDPVNFHLHDFDNDGATELFNNTINNINGTTGELTAQASNFPAINTPFLSRLSFGDFDNNGLIDFLKNNDAIYLQTSANTFTRLASSSAFAGSMSSPIVMDINKDGSVDIIDVGGKAIWLNQALTFTKQATLFSHFPVFPIELNGDGFMDFIVRTGNSYYTCINGGSMNFTYTPLNIPQPIYPVGDINNDGRSDLAGGNGVYFNSGSGTFTGQFDNDYYLPGFGPIKTIAPGNFDGDGDLDLAVSDSYQMVLVRNNQEVDNQKPGAPTNLVATRSGNTITLTWNAATDDTTPQSSLTYNVYVKNGANVIVSAHSLSSGKRLRIDEGNASLARVFKITGLPVGTYQWSVQAIDKSLEASVFAAERTFYITNNPTNIALSNSTIAENSTAVIGVLSTTDVDAGETFTYSLVAGAGSTDNALFKITGNSLSALSGTSLNFENKTSYAVRVRTTDSRNGTFEKAFTVTVTNVQETATDIALSASFIEENAAAGTEVGTLTSNDPDAGDTHTYTLVAGTGDEDNGAFEISTNQLKSKEIFNYEIRSSFSVRIQAADQGGRSFQKVFAITVTDINDLSKPTLNEPTGVGQTYFSLSWPAIEGATEYEIELSLSNFANLVPGYNPKVVSTTSVSITNLLPGAEYRIRMRAANADHVSPDSDPVVQVTIPADPVALDPVQIDVSSFKAAWSASPGASSYELEVSPGGDGFTPIEGYDPRILTGALDDVVTGLTPQTVYKYRVRAVNDAGKSGYSNEESVETLSSTSTQTLSATMNSPSGMKFSLTLANGSGARTVQFSSRPILSDNFTTIDVAASPANANLYEVVVNDSQLDEMGIEGFFTAADETTPVALKTASAFIYTPIGDSDQSIRGVSFGGQPKDWRIFSIPYKLERNAVGEIFGAFGTPDKTRWRVVQYQNGENIDLNAFSLITHGQGYWFNSVEDLPTTLGAGTSPEYNQGHDFVLDLNAGWNLIGAPYPFDIDFEDVRDANSLIVSKLVIFDPATVSLKSNSSAENLKAWSGGFVFADAAGPLRFPVKLKNSAGGRTRHDEIINTELDQPQWRLPLTLRHGDGENAMIAIGMHPEASESKDRFDAITVPRFLHYLEMDTRHEEFFAPWFTQDIVSTQGQYTWHFTVRSSFGDGKAVLRWDPESLGVNEAQLLLYDEAEERFIDMKTNRSHEFYIGEKRSLKITYTNDDGHWDPGFSIVGKPYPNPSGGAVTLPLTVQHDKTFINIEIYDMFGRMVKHVVNEEFDKGIYSLSWKGDDDLSDRVRSGVYIVQTRTSRLRGKILHKLIMK